MLKQLKKKKQKYSGYKLLFINDYLPHLLLSLGHRRINQSLDMMAYGEKKICAKVCIDKMLLKQADCESADWAQRGQRVILKKEVSHLSVCIPLCK